MKTYLSIIAIMAGALLGFSQSTLADTESSTGTISIVSTITVTEEEALDFGDIIPGTGGVVYVTSTINTARGGVILARPGTPGVFTVTGTPDASFTTTITPSITLTTPSKDEMDADLGVVGGGTFDGSGLATLTVGGRLIVEADQEPGLYSATYSIDATY